MTTLLRTVVLNTLALATMGLQAQELNYQWLNFGCQNIIQCDVGCTACDVPENSSELLLGTNSIWIGTDVCPFPTAPGDNSLFSSGWPLVPENGSYGLLSGLTLAPLQLDTLVIRHARSSYGPHRLKVLVSFSPESPFVEVADVDVDWNFQETVITDLGCVPLPATAPYGIFQVKFQAYAAIGEGSWVLDDIRIVGSTCSDLSTAVPERDLNTMSVDRPLVDVLGRKVGTDAAPGVYMGGKRIVVVQ
jgi:hypothetical protein